MNKEPLQILESVLKNFEQLDYIHSADIPNIPLYMDQVTTFMEEHLRDTRRTPDDKVLTKTMINNYTKNKLLPPPEKKKYDREHLLVMIFIYYWKGLLPLQDIQSLLRPINEHYFKNPDGPSLTQVYDEVFRYSEEEIKKLTSDVRAQYESSLGTFEDESDEDQRFLQFFSLICSLTMDMYMKKKIVEHLIDEYLNVPDPKIKEKASKKDSR